MAGRTYTAVVPSAARTVAGNGGTIPVDFSDETELLLHIKVAAVSGTSPTMTVSVAESLDGGTTWVNVSSATAVTAAGTTRHTVPITAVIGPMLRIGWTIGGTTPSFTFSVDLWAK
jgi:hypothetical protein